LFLIKQFLIAKFDCSSKTAPRILFFSIAMGADFSFYVKTLETHASVFLTLAMDRVVAVK
jgi:hypothetical protein